MVSRELFAEHCWAAHDALAATASEDGPGMPGYFRFLTLLGLRLALASHVDVLVLEVGIGGRLDATNVVPRPAVCGVTALGCVFLLRELVLLCCVRGAIILLVARNTHTLPSHAQIQKKTKL